MRGCGGGGGSGYGFKVRGDLGGVGGGRAEAESPVRRSSEEV